MNRRGFTLIELMIVSVILSIMGAALGAWYLEARISGARIEASLQMEREASLATEWLRRDLRGASKVSDQDGVIVLERREGSPVRYTIDAGKLIRDDGAPRALGRHFRDIAIAPESARIERVSLSMERTLTNQATARVERSFVVVRLP